ncbi:MAG: type II toxin-antitoxin system death-on-curing family toxin [Chloroflexota bacterium]|nr:type II toxin-antitoxin system death-on-curing family toxin [Chloroflexota bacterium]MDE2895766.1 type II toxin-antitoxin system death-on-curing family toxin [Chloroflexota bacterium]
MDRNHVEVLCAVTANLYPQTPLAFQLQGEQGQARLDSALAVPRQPNHRSLAQKAAALHYHLNKGHPFIDGNKRFAVAAMEVFLWLNDATLWTTDEMLEQISLDIARDVVSRTELAQFVQERISRNYWDDDQVDRWLTRTLERGLDDLLAAIDLVIDGTDPMPMSVRLAELLRRRLPSRKLLDRSPQ